jgi:hypothetical protein
MTERVVSPRLTDIVEAIEHIRAALDGVSLEALEGDWQKRWRRLLAANEVDDPAA